MIKAKPAGRVPPDAILLSGNKSMQKCLLLAEGYRRSRKGYGFQYQQRRRAGPLQGASPYCCQNGVAGSRDETSCNLQVRNLKPFYLCFPQFNGKVQQITHLLPSQPDSNKSYFEETLSAPDPRQKKRLPQPSARTLRRLSFPCNQ